MHPLVVILSLLVGGQVGGFIGIVLAVPLAVLAQEIFAYFAQQKRRRPVLDV